MITRVIDLFSPTLHAYCLTYAGQSSPSSSGVAVDPDVGAAPLNFGATSGKGHSTDLCTAGQHQGGRTFFSVASPDAWTQFRVEK